MSLATIAEAFARNQLETEICLAKEIVQPLLTLAEIAFESQSCPTSEKILLQITNVTKEMPIEERSLTTIAKKVFCLNDVWQTAKQPILCHAIFRIALQELRVAEKKIDHMFVQIGRYNSLTTI